jgi:hypothetical protein
VPSLRSGFRIRSSLRTRRNFANQKKSDVNFSNFKQNGSSLAVAKPFTSLPRWRKIANPSSKYQKKSDFSKFPS